MNQKFLLTYRICEASTGQEIEGIPSDELVAALTDYDGPKEVTAYSMGDGHLKLLNIPRHRGNGSINSKEAEADFGVRLEGVRNAPPNVRAYSVKAWIR